MVTKCLTPEHHLSFRAIKGRFSTTYEDEEKKECFKKLLVSNLSKVMGS